MEHDQLQSEEEIGEQWLAIEPGEVLESSQGVDAVAKTKLWALVLHARAVPYRLETGEQGEHLLAPRDHLDAAYTELRLFEAENLHWPPPAPPVHPLADNTLATISVLLLLAIFHNFVQLEIELSSGFSPDWLHLGNAQAGKIMDGQWWRLLTALTLHADSLHLLSNLLIGGCFVILLCRELGSGLAWSLLLGAGVLGNLVNAFAQPSTHSSVGASTAVFGAVGILAAISMVRYRNTLRKRWSLPVAAALALLALLGTEGKNTDLGAHLFGFIYGGFLGLITEYLLGRYGLPGRALNALLALCSVAAVVIAWSLAIFN